jgi:predicted membrane-bound mannosyltransferase
MTPSRRQLLHFSAAASGLLAAAAQRPAHAAPGTVLAPRLRPGDTIGLVSPANATFEREPLRIAIDSLQALGSRSSPARMSPRGAGRSPARMPSAPPTSMRCSRTTASPASSR